jgi:hypothetical protein
MSCLDLVWGGFWLLQLPTIRNLKFQNGFRKKEKKTRTLFLVYMNQM